MAIVTYKGYPPPQLWLLRRTLDGIRLSLERQFCAREHRSTMEYNPMHSVQFSGKGHFLHMDRFIICTTTEGKIHFWRRDKSDPVHVLGGLATEDYWPMQISTNRAREDFMFATRNQDGIVRIWKTQDEMGGTDQNALGLSIQSSTQPLDLSDSPPMGQLAELPEDIKVEGVSNLSTF
ncbi:hypothetical protein JB92DRAFT_1764686 [Gautieria morchelliformis]|nr:hypothetical protein JB92DRAFT_1764686 [Gautieria morchelliformis]